MVIVVKGAGDLATGIAHRLKRCGFDILMTEITNPTMVRRTVSFSQAIYDNETVVEGIKAVLVKSVYEAKKVFNEGNIAVIVDEESECIKELNPDVVVDSIIAKKNIGTKISDAKIVIAVGPGFTANVDCHAVVETKRGHYLGKVIFDGEAIPNTGVPGDIGGYTTERIIRASDNGIIKPIVRIGDYVNKGDVVAYVNETPIYAEISGIVRGMLQDGLNVYKGMKSGDIDPRCEASHCFTISDKARAIGGGVLEAILCLRGKTDDKR